MQEERTPEDELIEEVAAFSRAYDVEGLVDFLFPWGEEGTDLEGIPGPRAWQRKLNRALTEHLQDPKTRFQPFHGAIASGHGIGKTGEIGMLINTLLSMFEDCKVVYTANTETQLRTKTTPEIHKWHRMSLTSHWFKPTATAMHSVDKLHEKSWKADAITWSENNTEAFQGLHNKKKCIVVIFEEASAIPDKVWEVTEGALTDEETIIIWLAFANPTRATGRFRECFRKFKHRWFTMQVDSRDVEGTNKVQIKKWEEDYGVDSDFFKVRVRGIFPAQSLKQFISEEDVDAAYERNLREEEYSFAPKIIAVEPAWEGDDEFVIGMRQGLFFKILGKYPKNDNDIDMAAIVAAFEDEEEADAVFIDMGYGTGIVSAGRSWKRGWKLVEFGGAATKPGYLNKRAEIWGNMKQWLKDGGAIPPDPLLRDELMAPETVGRTDGKIQLESKKDMKARGVPSPNRADCLAITFAYPVQAKAREKRARDDKNHQKDWKPLRR